MELKKKMKNLNQKSEIALLNFYRLYQHNVSDILESNKFVTRAAKMVIFHQEEKDCPDCFLTRGWLGLNHQITACSILILTIVSKSTTVKC